MTGCRGRGALTSSSIDQLQEEDSKYGESTTAENTKVRNKEFVAWKFREHVIDSCDLFTLSVLWRRQLFYVYQSLACGCCGREGGQIVVVVCFLWAR